MSRAWRRLSQFPLGLFWFFLCANGILWTGPRLQAQDQTPANVPGQTAAPDLSAPAKQNGDLRFAELQAFTNLTRITGAGSDSSFLTDGNNSAVNFSYLEDWTFGLLHVEASTNLRYTDDPRYDPEHSSVQRAYLRVSGPRYEYNFGDYLVSYSGFTYNQNLKGVNLIQKEPWGYGFRLLANAGVFSDRYGSVFKQDIPGSPFTRVVSGVRAEQKIAPDRIIGLNWSYGNDIVNSVPIDPTTGTEPYVPVDNNVVSLDTKMLFAKIWTLDGEIAYSRTDFDTRVNSTFRKDYALRFDNSVRTHAGTFDVLFTRIMPSFLAVNARQVADLQDLLTRATIPISSHLQAQAIYRRTQDDLRHQNPTPGTVFQAPEFHLSFRDLAGLGSTVLDVGYRERYQKQLGLADQVTRTPFFEVGVPIASAMLTVGYEHRANEDHLNGDNQSSANDGWIGIRGAFDAGGWSFLPVARYELNRELFDSVEDYNNTRNITTSLTIDAPRYFSFDAQFRQVGATLFGDQPLLDPVTFQPVLGANGLPESQITGPTGFRRPAFRFAAVYKFRNNSDHFLTLSYEQNDNLYAVPGQDFLERVAQVMVTWRFREQ